MDIINFNDIRVGHFDNCVDIRPIANNHESYGTVATFHTFKTPSGTKKQVSVFKETTCNGGIVKIVVVSSCIGHDPMKDKPSDAIWELISRVDSI